MKFPICPYCRTAYSVKALASVRKTAVSCCYCGSRLTVSRYPARLAVVVSCAALVLFNTVVLFSGERYRSDLVVLVIANAATVFSSLLMAPLMLRFHRRHQRNAFSERV